jgi:hypothetical protein
MMASGLVHFSVVGLLLLFSEVHPFGKVTAEPIAIDLVTPEQVAKEPPRDDRPQLQPPEEDSNAPRDTESMTEQAPPPPPQAALPPQPKPQSEAHAARTESSQAAAQPQPQLQLTPQAPVPSGPAPQQPAYTPPQPDITVKYGVMLGLPEFAVASAPDDKPGDGIDATASSAANIASSLIAKFRQHLKTCAKLPPSLGRSDRIFVKLRVLMTPQARLAAEPILIEGTASAKALELKQSAVQALNACQPYNMLPSNRYGEWKVLDLSFTPQDFA